MIVCVLDVCVCLCMFVHLCVLLCFVIDLSMF